MYSVRARLADIFAYWFDNDICKYKIIPEAIKTKLHSVENNLNSMKINNMYYKYSNSVN